MKASLRSSGIVIVVIAATTKNILNSEGLQNEVCMVEGNLCCNIKHICVRAWRIITNKRYIFYCYFVIAAHSNREGIFHTKCESVYMC